MDHRSPRLRVRRLSLRDPAEYPSAGFFYIGTPRSPSELPFFPGGKHKLRLCVRGCITGKFQWLQTQSFSLRGLGPPLLSLRQDLAAGWYSQRRLLTTREFQPGQTRDRRRPSELFCLLMESQRQAPLLYQTSLRPRRPSQRPKPNQLGRLPRLLHKLPRRIRGR
jgi:hypothetical protein